MAKSKSIPELVIPREKALRLLSRQVKSANDLAARRVRAGSGLEGLLDDIGEWVDESYQLLFEIVSTSVFAREYRDDVGDPPSEIDDREIVDQVEECRTYLYVARTALISIKKRVEIIPEAPLLDGVAARSVFVVHGHDDHARTKVENFLRKLKFEPIVLVEETHGGKTIIEKFEDHSKRAPFAIVLLTPDDNGGKAGSSDVRPRARQNVIFELGYFIGKLGRNRVCALHKGDLELPSDFGGIGHTEMDERDRWHVSLAKEMKAAGLDVDMNLI